MAISPSVLTSGTTDTAGSSWVTPSISVSVGDVIVVAGAFYDASGYFSGLTVSGAGQTWVQLESQGNTSNLGFVGARYCVATSSGSGQLTLSTAGGNTYDAMSYVVVKFSGSVGERFTFAQALSFSASNRAAASSITLDALGTLKPNNLVVGYAIGYNTASEAIDFQDTGSWVVAGEQTGDAATSREIAAGIVYDVDTTDTTVSILCNAVVDRIAGGALEFEYGYDITSVTFTFTPVALTPSVGGISVSVSSTVLTLTPVALTASIGNVDASITPVDFSFTPVALTASIGNVDASITPVDFSFTPVALVSSSNSSITPVDLSFTPVALSTSSGNVDASITPVDLSFIPVGITHGVVQFESRIISMVTV